MTQTYYFLNTNNELRRGMFILFLKYEQRTFYEKKIKTLKFICVITLISIWSLMLETFVITPLSAGR